VEHASFETLAGGAAVSRSALSRQSAVLVIGKGVDAFCR